MNTQANTQKQTLPSNFKGFGRYNLKSKYSYYIEQKWNKFYLMFFYGEENKKVCDDNLINFGRDSDKIEFNNLIELKDFVLNNKSFFHYNQQEEILKEIEEIN